MMETQYDKSVETAKEVYRREARERERQEYLEREREGHKAAARVWFNLLTELWPPDKSEQYWLKASERLNAVYTENKDNKLLQELLLMTHGYLGDIAYGKHD